MTLTIGTRKSALAMWQTHRVIDALAKKGFDCQVHSMMTKGDKILDVSLSKIGSKGVFTEEIEALLKNRSIDLAVHSAKDMPSELPDHFELVAFGKREWAGDVLVGNQPINLDRLTNHDKTNPPIKIGTSSTRRIALINRHFPNVVAVPVRGNLQRRIEKLDSGLCDYLMLAHAGVARQGYSDRVQMQMPLDLFVPPAGQGSITIEVHKDLDTEVKNKIREAFNHQPTEDAIKSERRFLNIFKGGCSIPIFVHAMIGADHQLTLTGGIVSLDGQQIITSTVQNIAPKQGEKAGEQLAQKVLAQGGDKILADIKQQL